MYTKCVYPVASAPTFIVKGDAANYTQPHTHFVTDVKWTITGHSCHGEVRINICTFRSATKRFQSSQQSLVLIGLSLLSLITAFVPCQISTTERLGKGLRHRVPPQAPHLLQESTCCSNRALSVWLFTSMT